MRAVGGQETYDEERSVKEPMHDGSKNHECEQSARDLSSHCVPLQRASRLSSRAVRALVSVWYLRREVDETGDPMFGCGTFCNSPLNTVAEARLLAAAERGADGGLDALVPASVCERVDGRLNTSLGLLGVEEGLEFCRVPSGEDSTSESVPDRGRQCQLVRQPTLLVSFTKSGHCV